MRTRRSPRNQARLWKILSGPMVVPPRPQEPNYCGHCAHFFGERSAEAGGCTQVEDDVRYYGVRDCWEAKPAGETIIRGREGEK